MTLTPERAVKILEEGATPNYNRTAEEFCEAYDMAVELLKNRMSLISAIKNGILATDGQGEYFTGMRNGMRWALSIITGETPDYEDIEFHVTEEIFNDQIQT